MDADNKSCTCHEVNWWARPPYDEFIQTNQCPIHGSGPDALSPTTPPEPKEDDTNGIR
jgi:hypothetical protein